MKDYIVLDINHGGDILASILKSRGHNVIVYDIYQTRNDKKQKLEQNGIKLIESVTKDYNKYIIAYPVHCPDYFLSFFPNNEKITHHELVKSLFENESYNNKIVEITGSKGKTTTSNIIAYLLSFWEDTYLNSSRGLEKIVKGESQLIDYKNSISPGYTAQTLSQYNKESLILEESLGVCGAGAISILTSASPVYEIKRGQGTSLDAKNQVFTLSSGTIIIDGNDKLANEMAKKFDRDVLQIWRDVYIERWDKLDIGKDYDFKIYIDKNEFSVNFKGNYLLAGYINPILFGFLTLNILKKNSNIVANHLSQFNGVENRLTVSKNDKSTKIIDKSGGFSEDSLRYLLQILKVNYNMPYDNINLLIDMKNKSHCQKTNIAELDKVVGEFNFIDNAFLSGNYDFDNFKYLKNSEDLEIRKGDLLIQCGKG